MTIYQHLLIQGTFQCRVSSIQPHHPKIVFLLDLENFKWVRLHSEITAFVNNLYQNNNINYYLRLCLFLSKNLPHTRDFLDSACLWDWIIPYVTLPYPLYSLPSFSFCLALRCIWLSTCICCEFSWEEVMVKPVSWQIALENNGEKVSPCKKWGWGAPAWWCSVLPMDYCLWLPSHQKTMGRNDIGDFISDYF